MIVVDSLATSVKQHPPRYWSADIMHRHVTWVMALDGALSQWPAPSPDHSLNIDAPSAPLCVVVVWHWHFFVVVTTTDMSSLLKPFSVCEGPCESCGVRRGCPGSAPHHQPSSRRLAAAAAAAAGPGSLPAHQRSYTARRNLAAAAIGGRKLTHPGKAILAGWFLNRSYPSLRFSPLITLAYCSLHRAV